MTTLVSILADRIVELVAALGIGGGVSAWITARVKARSEARTADAAVLDSASRFSDQVNHAASELIAALQAQVNSLTGRLDQVETQVAECRREHEECQASLADTNRRLDAALAEIEHLKGAGA